VKLIRRSVELAPLLIIPLFTDMLHTQELKRLSPSAVDFLRSLLERDPALRPSAAQALEHPWVKEQGTAGELPLEGSVVQVGAAAGGAKEGGGVAGLVAWAPSGLLPKTVVCSAVVEKLVEHRLLTLQCVTMVQTLHCMCCLHLFL
jgi:serine/threonine protein kinase